MPDMAELLKVDSHPSANALAGVCVAMSQVREARISLAGLSGEKSANTIVANVKSDAIQRG